MREEVAYHVVIKQQVQGGQTSDSFGINFRCHRRRNGWGRKEDREDRVKMFAEVRKGRTQRLLFHLIQEAGEALR